MCNARDQTLKTKKEKILVMAHVVLKTQDLVIKRCCFAGYKIHKDLKRTCTTIVLLINYFFDGALVAVLVASQRVCFTFLHLHS